MVISAEHLTQIYARSLPSQYRISSHNTPSHERHRDLDAITSELNAANRDNENWFRQFLKSSSIQDMIVSHKRRMQELRANFTVRCFQASISLMLTPGCIQSSSPLSLKRNSRSLLCVAISTSWLPHRHCTSKQSRAGQRQCLARDLRAVQSICQGLDCILVHNRQRRRSRGDSFFSMAWEVLEKHRSA
jgi:hypothetical protein